eukprot:g1581.t1
MTETNDVGVPDVSARMKSEAVRGWIDTEDYFENVEKPGFPSDDTIPQTFDAKTKEEEEEEDVIDFTGDASAHLDRHDMHVDVTNDASKDIIQPMKTKDAKGTADGKMEPDEEAPPPGVTAKRFDNIDVDRARDAMEGPDVFPPTPEGHDDDHEGDASHRRKSMDGYAHLFVDTEENASDETQSDSDDSSLPPGLHTWVPDTPQTPWPDNEDDVIERRKPVATTTTTTKEEFSESNISTAVDHALEITADSTKDISLLNSSTYTKAHPCSIESTRTLPRKITNDTDAAKTAAANASAAALSSSAFACIRAVDAVASLLRGREVVENEEDVAKVRQHLASILTRIEAETQRRKLLLAARSGQLPRSVKRGAARVAQLEAIRERLVVRVRERTLAALAEQGRNLQLLYGITLTRNRSASRKRRERSRRNVSRIKRDDSTLALAVDNRGKARVSDEAIRGLGDAIVRNLVAQSRLRRTESRIERSESLKRSHAEFVERLERYVRPLYPYLDRQSVALWIRCASWARVEERNEVLRWMDGNSFGAENETRDADALELASDALLERLVDLMHALDPGNTSKRRRGVDTLRECRLDVMRVADEELPASLPSLLLYTREFEQLRMYGASPSPYRDYGSSPTSSPAATDTPLTTSVRDLYAPRNTTASGSSTKIPPDSPDHHPSQRAHSRSFPALFF